jgi:succinate dehydrogenase / fumarate reductase, membrane anchor subunit
MSDTMRTPLGKVRGLGSAREGVHHFILQRVTAVALLGLVPWFLVSLTLAVREGYEGAVNWIAQPLNSALILLTVGAALYHMRLGMQVIIEDYLTKPFGRNLALILNAFVCVAMFAIAAVSVLSIAA